MLIFIFARGLFEEKIFSHGKVIYSHTEQLECVERSLAKCFFAEPHGFDYLNSWDDFDCLPDENIEDIVSVLSILCLAYGMFFKRECFAGEHEYRIVFSCGHDGGRYKKYVPQYFRIKNEILIPFVKEKISTLGSLNSVLIGPRNTSDIAKTGLEYFFRNKKMDVTVKQSAVPLRY